MPQHKTASAEWISTFHRLVEMSYLGGSYTHDGVKYSFQPRLVKPYDFVREVKAPKDDFERLVGTLDRRFRSAARSEVYRTGGGWLDPSHIRSVNIGKTTYLLPVMSPERAVGIDTSTVDDTTYIVVCFIPDPNAAEAYLQRHLKLPKSRKREPEFKWSDLAPEYQEVAVQNFPIAVMLCCNAVLVMKTDVLARLKGRRRSVIANLCEGCFSGYRVFQGNQRLALRKSLFELANGAQIHCDADFAVPPGDVTRIFMRTLAKRKHDFEPHVPLHVPLRSHQSKPIQVADILVGSFRTRLDRRMSISPLSLHPFDGRKIRKHKGKTAKAYCWIE